VTTLELPGTTLKALLDYVGGLSAPSKMPGHGYSLPAKECKTGAKLREIEGSTCSGCYAMKGRYVFGNVQSALYRRLEAIRKDGWAEVMAEILTRKGETWFRWHDSGDLQDAEHLEAIIEVCRLTPTVSHWLPTREYRIVQDYVLGGGEIPENLNIRFSAHMIGGHVPSFPKLKGLVTVSTVTRDGVTEGHACPAPKQGNECKDCRACWTRSVQVVNYKLH
jgi:hypothetical protein